MDFPCPAGISDLPGPLFEHEEAKWVFLCTSRSYFLCIRLPYTTDLALLEWVLGERAEFARGTEKFCKSMYKRRKVKEGRGARGRRWGG